jgi:hypothetical protein
MPALTTQRLADAETSRRYPLPVSGEAGWTLVDGRCRLTLPLADLEAGTIVVPSLAFLPASGGGSPEGVAHRWRLRAGGGVWQLQDVPAHSAAAAGSDRRVSSHIDCFHIHAPLAAPRLDLELDQEFPPERYLACASFRALSLPRAPLPSRAVTLPRIPPARSQMTAPAAIAERICSPTCVSMVLDYWTVNHDWLDLAAECHDPVSGLYGVWPLALAAAARRGCLGAVEAFESWEEPLTVLQQGVPLVASIRFAHGELPDAPIDHSGGHLVVIHGAGPDHVAVCDPAAPTDTVSRRYPAEGFSRAWLSHRGAAYILAR